MEGTGGRARWVRSSRRSRRAVEGTPAIAMAASLVWGILSIVLSPCHLASIPLIVGFIERAGAHDDPPRVRASRPCSPSGILVTIGVDRCHHGRGRTDDGRRRAPTATTSSPSSSSSSGFTSSVSSPCRGRGPGASAQAEGAPRGVRPRPRLRRRARAVHVRATWRPMLGVTLRLAATNIAYGVLLLLALRRRTLLGHRPRRDVHRRSSSTT